MSQFLLMTACILTVTSLVAARLKDSCIERDEDESIPLNYKTCHRYERLNETIWPRMEDLPKSTKCKCQPGFYAQCLPCPLGYYKKKRKNKPCDLCGLGSGTPAEGAEWCTKLCKAGSHLQDDGKGNTRNCTSCQIGFYQPYPNLDYNCVPCPNNMTTKKKGRTSIKSCFSSVSTNAEDTESAATTSSTGNVCTEQPKCPTTEPCPECPKLPEPSECPITVCPTNIPSPECPVPTTSPPCPTCQTQTELPTCPTCPTATEQPPCPTPTEPPPCPTPTEPPPCPTCPTCQTPTEPPPCPKCPTPKEPPPCPTPTEPPPCPTCPAAVEPPPCPTPTEPPPCPTPTEPPPCPICPTPTEPPTCPTPTEPPPCPICPNLTEPPPCPTPKEPPPCPTCPNLTQPPPCPTPTELPPCKTPTEPPPRPTECEYSGMTYHNGDQFTPNGGCTSCVCHNNSVTCTGTKTCDRIRIASQSSNHSTLRPAAQAIDGDPNTLAVTAQNPVVPNSWWKLEYECAQTFYAVIVTNRIDCCYEQLGNLVITIDEQVCGRIGTAPGSGVRHLVECEEPLTGKTLKIQKEKREVLNLAEVKPLIAKPHGC